MEVWEADCGGTWCPKCPPNCGLVPAFQPWTAMAGCVLPLSETLYHRGPVRPKGGTGSKPSAVCRGESSQRCLALSALCGVMNNFWYSLGVLCGGEPQVLFLPISDTSELCQNPHCSALPKQSRVIYPSGTGITDPLGICGKVLPTAGRSCL